MFWLSHMESLPALERKETGKEVGCGIYGTRYVEYLTVRRFDDNDRTPEVFAAHLKGRDTAALDSGSGFREAASQVVGDDISRSRRSPDSGARTGHCAPTPPSRRRRPDFRAHNLHGKFDVGEFIDREPVQKIQDWYASW
jgi:hypothetical protein